MSAALRRKNDEKRMAHFSKPTGDINFLPPESFLEMYSLLVEACFMATLPKPEVQTQYMKRGGFRIPVRNFRAKDELDYIDQKLYDIRYAIARWLEAEGKRREGKSDGFVGQ